MRAVAFSLFLLLSAVCAPALAQTASLDDNQKAVMVFDMRLDQLRDSDLGKKLELGGKMSELHARSNDDGPDPATIDRIFGAMSAPESMESAQTIAMGQMPMEFFVQMVFNDAASVEDLVAKAKEEDAEEVQNNGVTFYKVPEEPGTPPGLLMRKVNATTVEMGTEKYLFQENRKPFTDNLESAWKGAPKGALRIVMDLEGAKGLISEAVEAGKQSAPDPTVGIYLDLVDNMKDLAIAIDFSGGDILALQATGVNESDAEELKEGLDSMLGIAKMGIQAQLPMMRDQDPDAAKMMEEIAKALNASSNGTTVSVSIPTPDGFDAWVVQQAAMLEGMMGGLAPGR